MKKNTMRLFLIAIIAAIVYVSYSLFLYRDYFKSDKNSLFFYIPIIIGTYINESNNEDNSYSKDNFYSFINSYYTDSLFIATFPTIRFLNRHKEDIRFDFHPDSNYFILYDIGIDGIDDSLKGKVFEKLFFYYPILRPKGDIMLGFIMPHNECDYRNGLNWYFKNGNRVAVKPMDSLITHNVYPDIIWSFQNDTVVGDSILLLFRLKYLESKQSWQGKLLCNWSQTDPRLAEHILDRFERSLSEQKFHLNADSIIYHFKYRSMVEGRAMGLK